MLRVFWECCILFLAARAASMATIQYCCVSEESAASSLSVSNSSRYIDSLQVRMMVGFA